jgi:hypothetical protein
MGCNGDTSCSNNHNDCHNKLKSDRVRTCRHVCHGCLYVRSCHCVLHLLVRVYDRVQQSDCDDCVLFAWMYDLNSDGALVPVCIKWLLLLRLHRNRIECFCSSYDSVFCWWVTVVLNQEGGILESSGNNWEDLQVEWKHRDAWFDWFLKHS